MPRSPTTLPPLDSGAQGLPRNIGSAASQSGVSAKMIRHYETLGLLGSVRRSDSGYRQYSPADVHVLRFIKRARDLGFSMAEIAELVSLWNNRCRASASVKRIAQKHLEELAQRVAALQAMQLTLTHLIEGCQGDQRPDCPILDELAGGRGHRAEIALPADNGFLQASLQRHTGRS